MSEPGQLRGARHEYNIPVHFSFFTAAIKNLVAVFRNKKLYYETHGIRNYYFLGRGVADVEPRFLPAAPPMTVHPYECIAVPAEKVQTSESCRLQKTTISLTPLR